MIQPRDCAPYRAIKEKVDFSKPSCPKYVSLPVYNSLGMFYISIAVYNVSPFVLVGNLKIYIELSISIALLTTPNDKTICIDSKS